MNQKFIIVDDFYDIACQVGKDIHLDFLETEFQDRIVDELTDKVSLILNRPIRINHVIN